MSYMDCATFRIELRMPFKFPFSSLIELDAEFQDSNLKLSARMLI